MVNSLTWVAGTSTPQKIFITRVWNFGTWEEWQKMWKDYTPSEIEEAVRHPLKGQWTRHGKAFAETLCGYPVPNDALISYDA